MFFIIGFAIAAFGAAAAMLILGALAVVLRKFGLVSLGPMLSIAVAAVPAGLAGQFLFRWSHKFQVPTDHLALGYYHAGQVGVIVGFILTLVICLWLSYWITPGAPVKGAGLINAALIVGLAVIGVASVGAPRIILDRQAAERAAYQAALDRGDVEAMRALLAKGYRAMDLKLAIQRGDADMMALFMDPPGGKPANLYVHVGEVLKTGNWSLLERFLQHVGDRQKALDRGLRMAVIDGRRDAFDHLLSLGAQVNNDDPQSVLMFAALHDRVDFLPPLLAASANVNALSGNPRAFGSTALIWAVGKGHINMARALLEAGADVNLTAPQEDSALHYASRRDSLELVELLLAHGADPSYANRRQTTPLHMAYSRKEPNQAIIDALIEAGADVDARDSQGRRPGDFQQK